jgi:hypothetical protein
MADYSKITIIFRGDTSTKRERWWVVAGAIISRKIIIKKGKNAEGEARFVRLDSTTRYEKFRMGRYIIGLIMILLINRFFCKQNTFFF